MYKFLLSSLIVIAALLLCRSFGFFDAVADVSIINSRLLNSFFTQDSDAERQAPTATQIAKSERLFALQDTQPNESSDSVKRQLEGVENDLLRFLKDNRHQRAITLLNETHSWATSDQIAYLKGILLNHAQSLNLNGYSHQAVALLEQFVAEYQEVSALRMLGESAEGAEMWPNAVDAYLRSTALENDDRAYRESLKRLVRSASYVRAQLERQGDELGILNLYKEIYEQYPNHARFALELAQSHLRLGDTTSALGFLENIRFDPELGALASQKIEAIESKNTKDASKPPYHPQSIQLSRLGTSLIAPVTINHIRTQLLLDTGASITALSSALIKRLKLTPTGKSIRVSTANGVRTSRLHQANYLRIGQYTIKDIRVAEIELDANSSFQGLLGTDVLEMLGNGSNYLIDNRNAVLIIQQ